MIENEIIKSTSKQATLNLRQYAVYDTISVMNREGKIEKLKTYFQKRDDVVMAFLFGSQAKGEGRTHEHSDWDIGVYFKPKGQELEYEDTELEYPEEDRINKEISALLETDNIDLVILNRAPAIIADGALRGSELVLKDRSLWLRFMLVITQLAEDFRVYSKVYYDIFQRSHSLLSDDAQRLERIITYIVEQNALAKEYQTVTLQQYSDDIHKRNDIEKWVENIMNAIIDAAQIILASSHRTMPMAYRDSVERAVFFLNVPDVEVTAQMLGKWARLRNVLSHEYLDIKWKRVSEFVQKRELYVQRFVDAAKDFLAKVDIIN